MSLYRSAEMEFYNLIIPRESAWDVLNTLGYLDMVHFVDYDPTLPQINRPFSNYVKRCDEVLQKIQLIVDEMKNYKLPITHCAAVKSLLQSKPTTHKYFDELEEQVIKGANDLMVQQQTLTELQDRRNTIIENMEVMKKALTLQHDENDENELLNVKLQQEVGVIAKEDELRFKRMVFRAMKGNVYLDVADIDKQFMQNNQLVSKCVFVVVYQGGSILGQKLIKVVESFSASRFEMPPSQAEYELKMASLQKSLEETQNLIGLTTNQISGYLQDYALADDHCSFIERLRLFVEKERYLYSTINLLKMVGSVFQGQVWLPKDQDRVVEEVLRNSQNPGDKMMPLGQLQLSNTDMKPPTYFKLNEFTWGFQEIVNTYGIPRYREINPGLSTLMTFPFLFGVMFADIGHGFLLFAFGIYLCNIDIQNSALKPFAQIKYMLLMMGFFAFYNGFIYNDYLSIALNLFGSCYTLTDGNFERKEDCAYPFGLDPVWSTSSNYIAFTNSFKMKLAVIIGVVHMLFGIVLKGVNALNSSNYVDLIFEFIPQFLLMICTFGYMDFMLITKWLTKYDDTNDAPSIITSMIDMVLQPFSIPEKPVMADGELQRNIQLLLLTIAAICVPTMLLPKPFIIDAANTHKQQPHPTHEDNKSDELKQEIQEQVQQLDEEEVVQLIKEPSNSHDQFSDLIVHQVIETIEFVLGSVSNTASYLRLWALSLAHSQLAEVFFDMTIATGIRDGGISGFIGMVVFFPCFAMITFGVLMCMDLMECFLHALRLQWVEFQNKFYKADGYLFIPFSYSKIKSETSDED